MKNNSNWWDLKELEMEILNQIWVERNPNPLMIEDLRKLISSCSEDTDSEEAICYHGALALLYEYEENWERAIHHRNIEISKIHKLHDLYKNDMKNTVLENCGVEDLRKRCEILEIICKK